MSDRIPPEEYCIYKQCRCQKKSETLTCVVQELCELDERLVRAVLHGVPLEGLQEVIDSLYCVHEQGYCLNVSRSSKIHIKTRSHLHEHDNDVLVVVLSRQAFRPKSPLITTAANSTSRTIKKDSSLSLSLSLSFLINTLIAPIYPIERPPKVQSAELTLVHRKTSSKLGGSLGAQERSNDLNQLVGRRFKSSILLRQVL